MSDAAADGRYDFLLYRTIPMVMAPAGITNPPRFRGMVRADTRHARIVLSPDSTMGPGIAVEHELSSSGGDLLDVDAAIDHARYTVAPTLTQLQVANHAHPRDSHGNIVLTATSIDFDPIGMANSGDQRLFSLFSLLVGGGIPWFADDYAFAGFIFTEPDTCRIYIRTTRPDVTYGIDLAVTGTDGRPTGYAYLAQELAALAHSGDLTRQSVLDDADDYCDIVIDLQSWMGPAGNTTPSISMS